MSSITEQFSAVTKSQLEAQFNIFNTFAHTAVDSVEKLIALHISTTKSSVEKSSAAAKQLLEAKDAKAFFSAQQQAPASFDSVLAYGRELYAIASGAQAELIKSTRGAAQAVPVSVTVAPVLAAPVAASTPARAAPVAPAAPAATKVAAPAAAPVSPPVISPVAPVAAPAVAAAAVAAEAPAPVAPPASIPAAVSAAVQAAVNAVEAPAPKAAAAVAAQHQPVAAIVAPTAPEKIQAAAVKPGAVELENKPPKLKAVVPPKAKGKK